MLLPPGREQGDSTFIGLGAGTILPSNNRNPEYHSWNMSVQREVGWSSVLEANYTGSRGTHLFLPITTLTPLDPQYWSLGRTALNAAVPNPFYGLITDPLATALNGPTVQRFRLLRPMPQFNGANVATAEPPIGDSSYHALQMKWDKRFSQGFSVLAHYTWSKMIDNGSHSSGNVSWLGGSTSVQNIWDLDAERSLSAHDVAHRVAIAGVWQLPFGRERAWGSNWNRVVDLALGGWSVSGVFSRQSGMPLVRHPIRRLDLGRHTAPGPDRRPEYVRLDPEPAQQLLQRCGLLAAGAGRPGHRAPDPQLPRAGDHDLRRRADEERRDSSRSAD